MSPGVFDLLLRAADLLNRDMARSLEPVGLSPARMHVLWAVHHGGPASQQRLARELAVTPRNITGLVDALVATGFVTREPHPTDRRAVLITLTPAAEEVMARSVRDHAALTEELLAVVDPADRAALLRGLHAVVARLTALVDEAAG